MTIKLALKQPIHKGELVKNQIAMATTEIAIIISHSLVDPYQNCFILAI